MGTDEIEHLEELLEAHRSRLREREIQAASFGIGADPIISIEIKEIKAKIEQIEKEIDEARGINDTNTVNENPNSSTSVIKQTPRPIPQARRETSDDNKDTSSPFFGIQNIWRNVLIASLVLVAIYLMLSSGIAKSNQPTKQAPTSIPSTASALQANDADGQPTKQAPTSIPSTAINANPITAEGSPINQITDTVKIEQILVSRSETQYRFEITLKNKLQQDVLIKRISLLAEVPLERGDCSNTVSGDLPSTVTVSDTFILKSYNENEVQFKGYVDVPEKPGYSYALVGSLVSDSTDCKNLSQIPESHLELQFNAATILHANEYRYININMPISIKITVTPILSEEYKETWTRYLENSSLHNYKRLSVRIWTDSQEEPIKAQFTGELLKP
jgi:hypothetical protein